MFSPRRALAAAAMLGVIFRPCLAPAARLSAASLRTISHTSDLLSRFWGGPIDMLAAVYVPARCQRQSTPCAVLYHLPGYGGSVATAWSTLQDYVRLSARVPRLAMAHVFLDPSVNGGYSYFTDSENNGPWDSALTQEFIPYVETLLGVGGSAQSRFLEGHSSGGWTVMWLQVSNPDFFRAVWAIAPDPLDFRHFYQVDATPGSTDNFYTKPDGSLRYLTRKRSITMKDLMQTVDDDPSQGGIISSYEFAWSPRVADGLPGRFFDRADGSLDQDTLQAWQAYDVEQVLDRGGTPLRDALSGKVHIYCGARDDFFYNEPTSEMCRFLRSAHYSAVCRIVPGRTHGTVFDPSSRYPMGLRHLILSKASTLARQSPR
jgi:S-formylglutathione hydrolase FrmB